MPAPNHTGRREGYRNPVSTTNMTTPQLSSLLDLENGRALKTLAQDARWESQAMRNLTEKATRDAAAVKVLTIITLVYLPATVVSVSGPAAPRSCGRSDTGF